MTVERGVEERFRARFAEYGRTLDCVHCGLCLPACPTYGVSGRESDSPRGRIYLMRGEAEGRMALSPEAERHLDECIVCRACETVCPSGIRMGEMMESFREVLQKRRRPRLRDLAMRAFLNGILPHRSRIACATDLLWFYERSGLARLARRLLRRLAPGLLALEELLPPLLPPHERRIDLLAASRGGSFRPAGKPRVRAALFLGCIASEWWAPVHRATIEVLLQNGCEVLVPPGQTCCGSLHRHAGYLKDAEELLHKNREALRGLGADVLVVNAAGCGASLKEPLPGSPEGLGLPVRDACELLAEIGLTAPRGRVEKRVAHHQPCHLVHAQRVAPAVVEDLLRKVPGLSLVPLADADRCCGAGGIYNLLHPHMARPLQEEKVRAVLASEAEVVAAGNPGCAFQIQAGLRGQGIEVLHPLELLARAYRSGADGPEVDGSGTDHPAAHPAGPADGRRQQE